MVSDKSLEILDNHFQYLFYDGQVNSSGVGMILRHGIVCSEIDTPLVFQERMMRVSLTKNAQEVEVLNLYVPADLDVEATDFLKSLSIMGKPMTDAEFVMLGDFNCVLEPHIDRSHMPVSTMERHIQTGNTLRRALMLHGLTDAFRFLHPRKIEFTFRSSSHHTQSRLDRFYVQFPKVENVSNVIFHHDIKISDHIPVTLVLGDAESPTGSPRKSINPDWFENPRLCESIAETLYEWKAKKLEFESSLDWWLALKQTVRDQSIGFINRCKNNQNKQLEQLNKEYASRNTPNETKKQIWEKISKLQSEIIKTKNHTGHEYYKNKHIMEDEYISLYLKHKVGRLKENCISKLSDQDGRETTNMTDMLQITQEFYANLYKSQNPADQDIEDFLDSTNLPQIPEGNLETLKSFLSLEEVSSALNRMNKNKAPGPDGLPTEFYLKFWNIIGQDITEVFQNIWLSGEIKSSFNQSVIQLIYKGKGEMSKLENYRPISLMNADYKMLSKVLASRIKPILPVLIQSGQTCSIDGKGILDNLLNMQALYQTALLNNERALFASHDLEKAFDRLEHPYLFKVLEKFGFPEELVRWIKILYSGANTNILVNSQLTESIQVERSVRQGDPLAMILYILSSEPLAIRIKNDDAIHGIKVPNMTREAKGQYYADDGEHFLDSINSFLRVRYHYREYGKASGSKLNDKKTEILLTGEWSEVELAPISKYVVAEMEVLGVYFSRNMAGSNYFRKVPQCIGSLNKWSNINLSFRTRLYIIKTFIIPQLIHVWRVVRMPEKYAAEMQRAISSFHWGESWELLPRQICHLPLTEGGLGSPNISLLAFSFYMSRLEKLSSVDALVADPWLAMLVLNLGFSIREINPVLNSNRFRRRLIPDDVHHYIGVGLETLKSKSEYNTGIWGVKSHRKIYGLLLNRTPPPIVLRNQAVNWKMYWEFLWQDVKIKNRDKEFIFLQTHGRIQTKCKSDTVSVRVLRGNPLSCFFL